MADQLSDPRFIHLRLHTEYSLVDGLIDIKALVKRCAKLGMPAVAVTDQFNLFALVKFYKAAQGEGLKPVAGADLWVCNEADPASPYLLTLFVQNEAGYRALTELISRGYRENQRQGVPQIMAEWLEARNEGLIALSGGRQGQIGRALLAGNRDEARRVLEHWLGVFGDRFYLELQRTGRPGEEEYLAGAVELALGCDAPVVATNDVRFLDPGDFEAHEARVCINQGRVLEDPRRPRDYSEQQYLKSPAEMAELFADLPEALENSVEIAKRCNIRLTLGKNFLPRFPVPEGKTTAEFFAEESRKGLRERLAVRPPIGKGTPEQRAKAYRERLELEIGVINQMDFPGYFLIVADFIRWAKSHGIPVGPGRGSGAGSLVAYALKITDLDPIEFDLLFERFLNPERVSMPDFDVDFCMDRRDEVIAYVAEKYGRDRVSQIITYGSMAAKAVVRDVGRVLGHPYGFVDRIAKLIPFELGMTLEKALQDSEDLKKLYDSDEEVKALIDLARSLEGLARNAGKHAGGVVIAPSELIDFSPLYCEQGGDNLVTQFDKDDVEAVGLVKFDFLGLRTLTIIDWALETINRQRQEQGQPPVDIALIPLDDPDTFKLLKSCQTTAVFQLESRGMKDLIRRLLPDNFEDIVALVALFRPGPLQSGMVDDYINVKHGKQKAEYPHPILEPILKPTNGVILYQEQVMRIAQDMSGYTLGGADLLRRAMGKKKAEEMAKQRDTFVSGAEKNGVQKNVADFIFDLVDKFSGYGFNKCIIGNTVISEANTGEQITVESLFNKPRIFAVHALDETGKLRTRQVSDVVWNGFKPVFELTTTLGKRITATANHPFRTLEGWTNLENLRNGDRIAVPRKLHVPTQKSWPKHELITLAGLLSEGNTCHPTCLYFYGNERALVEDFASAAEQFPDSVARVYPRSNGRLEACVSTGRDTRFRAGQIPWNARQIRISGNLALASGPQTMPIRSGAFRWVEELGLLGKKATEKAIPASVFELCDADLKLFLGRLWAGDGFIATPSQAIPPFYATSSRSLAEGVQTLLLRLGIISRIESKQFKYRDTLRPGFAVWLLGESALEAFAWNISPHIIGRDAQIKLLHERMAVTQPGMTSKDIIPADVRSWVADERIQSGLTWKELEQRSGVSMKEFLGKGSAKKQGFRRSTIARLAKFFSSERLAQLADSDVFWDRVASIESMGMMDTYDLTVEKDHNFVANGIIVHNSHSAAYALVSYQTAWLKAHFPSAFMAAVLSSDMDKTDKVVVFIEECRQMKLTLRPPDINRSEFRFTAQADGSIQYGLGAIKGVGENAIGDILEERRKGGRYADLYDLCRRIDLRKANRRVLEALIRAGALDSFDPNRARFMAELSDALKAAEQHGAMAETGQDDLFGLAAGGVAEAAPRPVAQAEPWSEAERLDHERNTLGLYLTGHPIGEYEDEIVQFVTDRLGPLAEKHDRGAGGGYGQRHEVKAVVAGLVVDLRTKQSKSGKRMGFATLDDRTGRLEVAVFSEAFERCRDYLVKDTLLVAEGSLGYDDFAGQLRLSAERLMSIEQARAAFAKHLTIAWPGPRSGEERNPPLAVDELRDLLKPYRGGGCPILIEYRGRAAQGLIQLGEGWRVVPGEELLSRLRKRVGEGRVRLFYH
jgi:DNA polymerase-3 subunit alpha